jgi:hypothetical protein
VPSVGWDRGGHLIDLAAEPLAVLGAPAEGISSMNEEARIFQVKRTGRGLWAGSDPEMCIPREPPAASAETRTRSAPARC